jgi:signal transduction histidine kinase
MTARQPGSTFYRVKTRSTLLRRLTPDPFKVDRVLGVVLAGGAELAIWLGDDASRHRIGAAVLAPTLGLIAFRRRAPLLVGALVPMLLALDNRLFDPQFIGYPVGEFCALYALAVWTSTRGFILGAAAFAGASLATAIGSSGGLGGTRGSFTVLTLVVMLLVRRVVGDRERRVQLAERERDLAAREAVVEERARIARELHDVIAHNVSMMVVQAGAERRVLDQASPTREVLETVERIGRSALTEMRRLVGMLRSEDADPLAPQPGLRDLSTLVTQVREAGLPVDLVVEGEPRELPAGIDLSAYRIVQEALTNALKHAGDARAAVRVQYGADALELEIADNGTGSVRAVGSGGHGLVGMQERVALYGGRLDAGRRSGGGFSVRVVLPIR